MPDETPPIGFDLAAEKSREHEAATAGITARESVPELDPDAPVDGVDGSAPDDHDVVDHGDRTPIGEDV